VGGDEVWCEHNAHNGVIYDIKWSKDDSLLVSCSNDGTCKVWDVLYFQPHIQKHLGKSIPNAGTLACM
jgi:WD40 repeat protein